MVKARGLALTRLLRLSWENSGRRSLADRRNINVTLTIDEWDAAEAMVAAEGESLGWFFKIAARAFLRKLASR